MKQKNRFIFDMLDQDAPESQGDVIYKAGKPRSVRDVSGSVILATHFGAQEMKNLFLIPSTDGKDVVTDVMIRSYGDSIVRVTASFGCDMPDDRTNTMLEWDPSLPVNMLRSVKTREGWTLLDEQGKTRATIRTTEEKRNIWSTLQPEPQETFDTVIYPDGQTPVPFMAYDEFFPSQSESMSLGFVKNGNDAIKCFYSLHAEYNEKFAGLGERFCSMNLAGKTFVLENTDGLGVNSRRAYKNVPFYVSSKGYGLLVMTSSPVRMSLADISTRSAQGMIEDDVLDLFFIGGTSVEQIVKNYRRITGFPANVPVWSYGTWMSRMTYFSADETREVVKRMRKEKFPCDVIHIDTGWFKTDWKCEWEFNTDKFPEPEKYFREMADAGIRISLWQLPCIAKDTRYYDVAVQNRYIAPKSTNVALGSNFSDVEFDGTIDFSNSDAVRWYQGLLEDLLRQGAAVIKTDFGEAIEENADYLGMPYRKLHNVYSLLYQKAAYDITGKVHGPDNTMIWARAGWIGCQRYPLHWSGDCACSWEGMAGSLRGGLHLGVSGFAFWSHDVPGFHGVPSFMNSVPANDLYIRWTQMGVFTSHIRYHGTTAREPYEYPEVADLARKWLNLRYALIPYLVNEGKKSVASGYPVLRALIFHHDDDPICWTIDDEFYCGEAFLVAPVMNSEGIRDVYLPAGTWIDFWTGERIVGEVRLKKVVSPVSRIPVFVKYGEIIPVYPENVQCTDEMDPEKITTIKFDDTYKGFSSSILGRSIGL